MNNSTNNVTFTQESIDGLMESFNESAEQLSRLASPLANINIFSNEDGNFEN